MRFRTLALFLCMFKGVSEAQTTCMSNGGFLYNVNTLENFHIALQLLMECSSGHIMEYIPKLLEADLNVMDNCPADASLSTNVFKSGGKLFTVRAFLDIARTFDEAQTTCMSNGGVLYKVNTLEKFHIAMQLLKECSSVYAPHAYWVNGKKSGITQEFETLDGEVIPMTSDFWAPGMPDQSGDCMWMWADYDYMLDDRECWLLTGFETNVLCELPL